MTYDTDERRVPVPEGDGLVIEGRILSLREKRGQWGLTLKMTVKVETEDGAYLVWGTRPSALDGKLEQRDGSTYLTGCADVGDVVRFTANVTRSERDESFGFFHRPRKASIIAQVILAEDEEKR